VARAGIRLQCAVHPCACHVRYSKYSISTLPWYLTGAPTHPHLHPRPCPRPHPHPADPDESLLRHSDEKLPGHSLALSLRTVWEEVRDHRDLNLPAHRVRRGGERGART
jgi:hypothetical protein